MCWCVGATMEILALLGQTSILDDVLEDVLDDVLDVVMTDGASRLGNSQSTQYRPYRLFLH